MAKIIVEMKLARDRAMRRLEALDYEVTAARREVDDWNLRIIRSEERQRRHRRWRKRLRAKAVPQ